jgi:hypothetical protein
MNRRPARGGRTLPEWASYLLRRLSSRTRDVDETAVLQVVYEAGSEFDPADPFGLCALTVRSDGAAELVNRARGVQRSYRATVSPAVFDRLLRHLRDAGFPDVPEHPIPAGPTRRVQLLGTARQQQSLPMAFHETAHWPGYREAFHLLDSLVVAVSEGALPVVAHPETGLLRK